MAARRHYFFDMDGTLSESRKLCSPEMKDAIMRLAKKYDVIIVSGAHCNQMRKQLPFLPNRFSMRGGKFYVLSQSGTFATQGGRKLWERKLNTVHKTVISEHIRVLKSIAGIEPEDPNDLVQDRGGQISYSLIGHNAPLEEKKAFDPTGSLRTLLLRRYPLLSTTVQVRIGGTTCLDYTATGWGKRGNIGNLLGINKWNAEDCVYVGDQLYEGGNDYEVHELFGWEGCKQVSGPEETLEFINTILNQPV